LATINKVLRSQFLVIHVADVARANYLALHSTYSGVLNVATGNPETVAKLLSYIEASSGQKAQVTFAPPRVGDILASYATIQKAEQVLAFRAEWSLQAGIAQLMKEEEGSKIQCLLPPTSNNPLAHSAVTL
jgi:nucleoside-diphosphate-sugar epimerase